MRPACIPNLRKSAAYLIQTRYIVTRTKTGGPVVLSWPPWDGNPREAFRVYMTRHAAETAGVIGSFDNAGLGAFIAGFRVPVLPGRTIARPAVFVDTACRDRQVFE